MEFKGGGGWRRGIGVSGQAEFLPGKLFTSRVLGRGRMIALLKPAYRSAIVIFRDSVRTFADGDCELARTLKLKGLYRTGFSLNRLVTGVRLTW